MRVLVVVVGLAVLAGCGDSRDRPAAAESVPTAEATATPTPGVRRPARRPAVGCAGLPKPCRAASGTVIYVEKVDPDGDGDAHYVLASRQSITLPGVTVIDVAVELRPRRLPRRGEWVSAAGPVQIGSYRQRQIHALRLRHHRRARPAR